MTQIFIEGTSLQQSWFDHVTGEIPITVHDGGDGMTPSMVTEHRDPMHDDDPTPDPFEDDEPIVATCDLSNPEVCESCT